MIRRKDLNKRFNMFFGRLFGWLLLLLAVFTASAEAVAALGAGEHVGLATSDVLTIITGLSVEPDGSFVERLLRGPAWLSIGAVGLALIFLCRKKKYKTAFSPKGE